jgi:hypothetical protein
MRNVILENIRDGLETELGEESSYNTLKVEEVQSRLPDSVMTNYFIGMSIDRAEPGNQEIGKYHPSINEYLCSVVVRIKNGDYEEGQTELDTIVRRVLKYFALDSGSLNGLSSNEDEIEETVISYKIENFDYVAGRARKSGLLHICMINLRIKTNLNI